MSLTVITIFAKILRKWCHVTVELPRLLHSPVTFSLLFPFRLYYKYDYEIYKKLEGGRASYNEPDEC